MPNASQQKRFFVLTLLCLFARPGLAQTDNTKVDGSGEQALMEKWHKVYDSIADTFQVRQISASNSDLNSKGEELRRQTLLHINNPQFDMRHGHVYLWTDHGRPIVIGSVKSVLEPDVPLARRVFYQFHSVSQIAVSTARNNKVFWQSEKPGVTWLDGIEETPPSDNLATRLTQMKSIARRFTADNTANVFRLMPTPIYRYPSETLDVTDGAIFAYSLGTEPQIFLLVEARSNAWHLAFARSNTSKIEVRKEKDLIWSFEPGIINVSGVERDLSRNDRLSETLFLKWNAELRSISDPEKVLSQASH